MNIKRISRIVTTFGLALGFLLSSALIGEIHAAGKINLKHIEGFRAMQGDKNLKITVQSTVIVDPGNYFLYLTGETGGITLDNFNGYLKSGIYNGNATHTFTVDVDRGASTAGEVLKIAAYEEGKDPNTDDPISPPQPLHVIITENREGMDGRESAVDVDYRIEDGDRLVAGKTSEIVFSIFNRGSGIIRNAKATLELPEGFTITSGSVSTHIGYMMVGKTYDCKFSVTAASDVKTTSYPFNLNITGFEKDKSSADLKETIYIPVAGKGGGPLDLSLSNVKLPSNINAGSDFVLSFDVKNNASTPASNVKAEVKLPEGVYNKSKSVFLIDSIAPGGTETCSVTLYANKAGSFAMFEITAGSAAGEGDGISEFVGASIAGSGDTVNTPQLMVSGYSFGGEGVFAGKDFPLTLTLSNTSNVGLRNIKVTIEGGGVFIPTSSSNSFFIESIAPKSSHSRSITLAPVSTAEERVTPMTISTSYEDVNGGNFTASDVVSIPVLQRVRLVIDDILDPGYAMVGQPIYLNVNYYNMGKNTISNLSITAEGDFSTDGAPRVFIGNMSPGSSDYYSLNIFPEMAGPMNGKVIFTYEDGNGNQHDIEKEFTFNVQEWEEPIWDDMPMPEEPGIVNKLMANKKYILGGLAIIGGAVGAFVAKRRKKIRSKEFDLDE